MNKISAGIGRGLERFTAALAPGMERMRNVDHLAEFEKFAFGLGLCTIWWILICIVAMVGDFGTVR